MLIAHMPRSTGRSDKAHPSAVTLGQAINRAMKQSPIGKQTVLADALGIDQTSVSKMIRGKVAVTVERVAEIEDLCEIPRGQILMWAGFVSNEAVIEDYLAPPSRNDDRVIDLLEALERSVNEAKRERTRRVLTGNPRAAAVATGTHGEERRAATSGKATKPAKRPSQRPRAEPNE